MTGDSEPDKPWGNTLLVRAEVRGTGGRRLTGYVHLQPNAPGHNGPETLEDLLGRPGGFFPLTDERHHTVFLAKDQVLAVSIAADAGLEDPARLSAARNLGLEVELSDGTALAGTVPLELPPARNRAIDFLNQSSGFIGLHAADAIHFVNRRHVRVATPFD